MTETKKWKNRLLSSSVPMEYEVAKVLVNEGFAVHADYSYSRVDSTDAHTTKDFSVDLKATGYPPFTEDGNLLNASLTLLVECKHRHRGNKWLFFPDPNDDGAFSSFTLGQTIRAVDQFSPVFLKPNCTVEFDEQAIFCIKGVEIDMGNGNVLESEIKHGLAQLQYALPQHLTQEILFNSCNHEEDNLPFLYCTILLTTSEIYVANPNTTIKTVEDAESLESFAREVPYVVVYQEYGPDFDSHRLKACATLAEFANTPIIENLEFIRNNGSEFTHRLPIRLCEDLTQPDGRSIHDFFSQTIVCSMAHLPNLIREIKSIATKATLPK